MTSQLHIFIIFESDNLVRTVPTYSLIHKLWILKLFESLKLVSNSVRLFMLTLGISHN